MATALHPHHTPVVLQTMAPDMVETIKARIIRELKQDINSGGRERRRLSRRSSARTFLTCSTPGSSLLPGGRLSWGRS